MKKIITLSIVFLMAIMANDVTACGTSTAALCTGAATALSNYYGGTWTTSNASVATVSATGVVTAVAPGTATITNTYTTGSGWYFSTNTAVTTVTVSGVPTGVTATLSTTAICKNSKLYLYGAATGATSYSWTSPGGSSISSSSSLSAYVNSVAVGNTGVYTFSATNSCGTVKVVSAPVTVSTAVPSSVSASATPAQICAGTSLSLNGNATGATSYSWKAPGSATMASAASQNTTVPSITTSNAGSYTVTATNGCGSTKAYSSAVAVTAALPVVSASASPLNMCSGSALTLTGSASGATGYSWAGPGGTSVVSATSLSTSIPATITGNTGVYTLSATNVCGTVRATTALVNVAGAVPSALTATAAPAQLCSGSALTLSGVATGATSYSWAGPGMAVANVQNSSVSFVTTSNAGTYTFTATNACGTTVTTSNVVSVTAMAPTSVIASTPDAILCSGAALTLNGSANGATSYLWNGPGMTTTASQNASVAAVSLSNAGAYTFSATNICGTTSAIANVGVSEAAEISGFVSDVTCNGWSNGDVILGNIVISVAANYSSGYTTAWSNGSTSGYGIFGLSAGTYSVTVTVDGGCSTTKAFEVTQPTPIVAVTTITNSGANDESGEIDLVVTGGTAPYTYSWSTGSTSPDVNGLAHGSYCVEVTDANSCTYNNCYFVNNENGNARVRSHETEDSTAAINPVVGEMLQVTHTGAFPNPFTSSTNVSFSVPADGHTTVEVYNAVNGQKTGTIFSEETKAGQSYNCTIDGTYLPSGVYIYKISSKNSSYVGKVTLVK